MNDTAFVLMVAASAISRWLMPVVFIAAARAAPASTAPSTLARFGPGPETNLPGPPRTPAAAPLLWHARGPSWPQLQWHFPYGIRHSGSVQPAMPHPPRGTS